MSVLQLRLNVLAKTFDLSCNMGISHCPHFGILGKNGLNWAGSRRIPDPPPPLWEAVPFGWQLASHW